MSSIIGKINSFQSLGTVDGPGVRYVVFMQGCPLRCGCCHNPDTWNFNDGKTYTAKQVVEKVVRFKEYFGSDGGITISGGEPLLQAMFVTEVFKECKNLNINTCLDTSGCILNEDVKNLLKYTDIILLDIKYTDEGLYLNHVGCSYSKVLAFLEYVNSLNIPIILRQVIIPSLNDNEQNINNLSRLSKKFNNVKKIELLPFKKICQTKYDNLNIDFKFKDIASPTTIEMEKLENLLKKLSRI